MRQIPDEIFEDFKELDEESLDSDFFDYISFNIVINWLEICIYGDKKGEERNDKSKLTPKWETALEFPIVVTSAGRARLHEVANYFMLGNHSSGGKKTNRKFTIYPKNLFKAKQQTEKNKLERERLKIIEKFSQKDVMIGRPPDIPRTFRE